MNDTMRCPLRTDMAGELGECDKRCAWLIERRCKHGKVIRLCAVAAIAHKGCEPFRCWTNIFGEEREVS